MAELFECKIDEAQQDGPSLNEAMANYAEGTSLRREVINMRENIPLGFFEYVVKRDVAYKYLSWFAYACERPTRRRRTPVDVTRMIDTWVPLIKKLTCAHDVDEKDSASSELDEHLTPLLAAPVAQIREFYRGLAQRLKDDPAVPWMVWRLFNTWGTNVLDKITNEQELELKTDLAQRIAERSIKQIPVEDWVMSMTGALKWRSPEKLQEVEAALDAGHKPRVKGKESCLFMEIDKGDNTKVEVML